MKLSSRSPQTLKIISIFIMISLLTACGGKESQQLERLQDGPPVEKGSPAEPGDDPSDGFEEIPLPEGFPTSFPIPDGARIGYSGLEVDDGSFQILIALGTNLEKALDYFRQALPDSGWTITEEEAMDEGHGMVASNPEYEGELYFVLHEEEPYVDVSLVPLSSIPEPSDVDLGSGQKIELGQSPSDFPDDFPLPAGVESIPLPDKLAGEGYQLTFASSDIPEIAYIQFSSALASSGWILGEFQMELETSTYKMPFSNPATGFEGYALMTANPDVARVNTIAGSIIGLHPGSFP